MLVFASCSKSDLLYDTDQKHTIYFNKTENDPVVNKFSFAYYAINDTVVNIPVKYMGMPVDKEQTFKVKLITDTIGLKAEEDKDFEYVSLTFPPNTVEADLKIRLNRSETLKDTVYAISLLFEENDIFTPRYQTFYKLQVEDGELPKPTWWDYSTSKPYNRFLGHYYPEKYKMLLKLFNEAKAEYPDFYKYSVENYGEFLNTIPENASPKERSFFMFKYSSIWGKYIFQPVWDYFTDPAHILPDDDISVMDNPIIIYK